MNFTLNTILRTDRPNSNGLCPIYLRYTFNRKYYNVPTELTISENYWNSNDNVFTKNFKERGNYNLLIGKIESEVKKIITDFKISHDRFPDPQELKTLLQSGIQQKKSLKNYFDDFIEYKKEKKVEKSTLTVYNTTWKIWEEFEKSEHKTFELKDMNFITFDRFGNYCVGLGKQNNTIGKYIKTFKTFLHYLESFHKITLPTDFKNVKKPSNDSDFEVFTQKELEVLKSSVFFSLFEPTPQHDKYNLTENEKLVGRMMVFLCLTGLSWTDFQKLKVTDIIFEKSDYDKQEGCYIKITRTKLKRQDLCVIPVLEETILLTLQQLKYIFIPQVPVWIFDINGKIRTLKNWLKTLNTKEEHRPKYYPRLFPVITNQEFNRDIKDLCKKLEMEDLVKVSVKKQNKIEEESIPKYKRISSHTGRRTYITQSLEQGVRMDILMKTTGHKKFDTMKKYTKISNKTINNEFIEKKFLGKKSSNTE